LELGFFCTDAVVKNFKGAFEQVLPHHCKIIALDMEAYNFYNGMFLLEPARNLRSGSDIEAACSHAFTQARFPCILAKAVSYRATTW
jgi:hypothetical protein